MRGGTREVACDGLDLEDDDAPTYGPRCPSVRAGPPVSHPSIRCGLIVRQPRVVSVVPVRTEPAQPRVRTSAITAPARVRSARPHRLHPPVGQRHHVGPTRTQPLSPPKS
jgi:hypothetical protein